MFGSLGVPELIFIFALALLIFGPRKLPEIGRTIGRGLSEFRKASTDLKRSINAEMIEEEMRKSDPRNVLREPPTPRAEPSAEAESPDTAGELAAADSGESQDGAPPEGSVPRTDTGGPVAEDDTGRASGATEAS